MESISQRLGPGIVVPKIPVRVRLDSPQAVVAQLVERILGKDEVGSSTLLLGSLLNAIPD